MYKSSGSKVESMCDQTLPGWSHDIYDRDWACFSGVKSQAMKPKIEKVADKFRYVIIEKSVRMITA